MHAGDAAVALDNMIHFCKNLSMAGGLTYVVACGAGRFSIGLLQAEPRRAALSLVRV